MRSPGRGWEVFIQEISREDKEQALDRVLASAVFSRSSHLQSFLRLVGEKSLNGDVDEIKEYTIGVEAFGRGHDFNPSIDPIVRVQAARLRQKLEEYYRGEGTVDPILISLQKGAYVPAFARRTGSPVPEISQNQTNNRLWNRFSPRARVLAMAIGALIIASVLLSTLLFTVSSGDADGPRQNPLFRQLQSNLNFIYPYGQPGEVSNLKPLPGEQRKYATTLDAQGNGVDYAVVSSMVHPISGNRILLFGGNTGISVETGARYLADPTNAAFLAKKLASPNGHFPVKYQILLKVTSKDAIPYSTDYVAHRSLAD